MLVLSGRVKYGKVGHTAHYFKHGGNCSPCSTPLLTILLPLGFMTITTMYKCVCICNSYNTGKSTLPDIYA